jgi:hypothetical protein
MSRLIFWSLTHYTIEDSLIIGRMVRNFVTSGELAYNIGERVSACTSPLFAAMACGIAWFGVDPLVAAKILGLVASTVTCVLLFDFLCDFATPVAAATLSGLYALLPPVIASSVGGMETPVYTLTCFLALERLARGRFLPAVVWSSMATLVRPDGVIVLLVVGFFVAVRLRGDLRGTLHSVWPMFVLIPTGVALHALYFHSVAPHSAIAKAAAYPVDPVANVSTYLGRMFLTWRSGLVIYALSVLGMTRLRDRSRELMPFASWYAVYHAAFMLRAPLFDWYLHPPLVVLTLFAALGLLAAPRWVIRRSHAHLVRAQISAGAVLLVALLIALPGYYRARKRGQWYEDHVRASAGLWLSSHASSGSLVFTESLGYIGYQTSHRFVDWPGLVSRDVPTLLRRSNGEGRANSFDLIIAHFHPDYLALRDSEWGGLSPKVKAPYRLCAEFPTPSRDLGSTYLIAGVICP